MYKEYYQFTSDPFRLTPDQRFVYRHPGYSQAREYMRQCLELGDGILVITGRSGTGKTTLVEDLCAELEAGDCRVATLVSTHLGDEDILRSVAYAFGLEPGKLDKATIIRQLEIFLSNQPHALLIVDEAQNLPETALEEIRMLTNMRNPEGPLLQVFLVGQEKLHERLHTPGLEQLHQRLMAAYELQPLDLEQTFNYVLHRLSLAGWSGRPAFSSDVFILIHRFSQGLPRYICKIGSRLLFHGAMNKREQLALEDVAEVVQIIQSELLLPLNGLTQNRTSEPIPDIHAILDTRGEPIQHRIALTPEEESFIAGKASVIDAASYASTHLAGAENTSAPPASVISVEQSPPVAWLKRNFDGVRQWRGAIIGGIAFLLVFGAGVYRLGVSKTLAELPSTAQSASPPKQARGSAVVSFNDYNAQTIFPRSQVLAPAEKPQPQETLKSSSVSAALPPAIYKISAPTDTPLATSVEESSTGNPLSKADLFSSDDLQVLPRHNGDEASAMAADTQSGVASTDETVKELLQRGATALEAYHLTTPKNDNARRYFTEVLALDPGNEEAQAGLEAIMTRYRGLTELMIQREKYDLAKLYIRRGLGVTPDPELLALREVLEERHLAEQAQEIEPLHDTPQDSGGFFDALKRLFSGSRSVGATEK